MKENILRNISIVLVSPQVPDNIGLAARALKNTEFSNLVLVNPNLTSKAFEVAKRSRDILERAIVHKSLAHALANSRYCIGFTRRVREYRIIYNFHDIKHLICAQAVRGTVSLVFGQEDFGLSGADLEQCDSVCYLPANPEFSSYNLAACIAIVCYELFNLRQCVYALGNLELAPKKDIETFFEFLETYLISRGTKKRAAAALLSLRRIFMRTQLTRNEVSLLKSLVLTAQRYR